MGKTKTRNLAEISNIIHLIPFERWRRRWCKNTKGCGCMGCVNGSGIYYLMKAGLDPTERLTEKEWELWMKHEDS